MKVAGVLLVFAFLIIPAVASMLICKKTPHRIIFGWVFGVVGCFTGLELSLRFDSTTGPTIVIVFILMLVLLYFYKLFLSLSEKF